MGPGKRLALLLASIRDASRLAAKSTVCLAGEPTYLLSSQGQSPASGAPGLHFLQHSAWHIAQASFAHALQEPRAHALGAPGVSAQLQSAPSEQCPTMHTMPAVHSCCSCSAALPREISHRTRRWRCLPCLPPCHRCASMLSQHCCASWGLCMLQQLEAHSGLPRLNKLCPMHRLQPGRRVHELGSQRAASACRATLHPGRRVRERSLLREMCWQRLRQTR